MFYSGHDCRKRLLQPGVGRRFFQQFLQASFHYCRFRCGGFFVVLCHDDLDVCVENAGVSKIHLKW